MEPQSIKLTFLELIKKYKIEIPIIQRDYAQGRESKKEIRENFLKALKDAIIHSKPLELDFVYGSVKDAVLQPLDGQQRLTTLFLLYWFVATKENLWNENLKELMKKFTYETRISSREFCNNLVSKGINYDPTQALSEQIINSSWFFLSWKKDPTIKSMLTMLDAIQDNFKDKDIENIWDKLDCISFHFIELENFGLSDDLYIKMNARGKLLTEFENFKAKFEQYIKEKKWEENLKLTETFSYLIDNQWSDLFWKYHNKETHVYDDKILNFFRTLATINYALKKDTNDNNFGTIIDLLRNKEQNISFYQYLNLDCFDEDYFRRLKLILNKISEKNGIKIYLNDTSYFDEVAIFERAIKNELAYPDLVLAFAYYEYLINEDNINIEDLTNWLRIVHNLVEGSRPYLFNNAFEFASALRSINKLIPNRNYILQYFADLQQISMPGIIREQVSEEVQKAKLILQDENWKKAIIDAENHQYFNGQIGFLLEWCKSENGEYNLDTLNQYAEKCKAIFGNEGLNSFENFLFERALLATGDYLLSKSQNYSFLVNYDRDISWKRLLRDNNEKRQTLKTLIDKISIKTLKNNLQVIIDNFSDKNDWRYYFIKYPEMIGACGSQRLIRFYSESNLLLLGSTTTAGYHKEYYSYSLFIELKNSNSELSLKYIEQRSVNYWKYFEVNDKLVAYDCNTQKYIYTDKDDTEFKNKKEFESREEAIKNLTIDLT